MGIVYRCKDLKMERDVAIKVIGWSLSDSQIVRFHREARLLAKLQHPNILAIENFAHSDDGSLFLVMELLTGQRLSDIIEGQHSIPFNQALEIFIQICNGLSHAHHKDILHRDIKPSNIFLEYTKYDTTRVTITDFGLAKLLTEDQRLTKTGISIGSPPYMSPEQAGGANVDERSDIYSVGCLMFEMLSGEKPFSGSSIPHILFKHAQETPPTLSDRAPERRFPAEIDTIITTCLAKSPADRFQTASELGNALQQLRNRIQPSYSDGTGSSGSYSQQAPVDGSTSTGTGPIQKQSRLVLHLVLSLTVLAMLAVAGTGWLLFTARGNDDSTPREEPYLTQPTRDEDDTTLKDTAASEPEPPAKKEAPTVVINWRNARKRLETLLEEKRLNQVDEFPNISLAKSDVRDKDLELLERLPIKRLNLYRTAITDRGLVYLSKLPNLEELDLGHTGITDEGIKLLQQFPSLNTIRLTKTAITDTGVTELSRCPNLKWIGLVNCHGITGATLGDLKRLKKLYFLNLARSGMQGENIKQFKNVQVYHIDLSGIQLDDSEISTLAEVTRGRLQMLLINHNRRITDKGFVELGRNTSLMMISIIGCTGIDRAAYSDFIQVHKLPVKIIDTNEHNRSNLRRLHQAKEKSTQLERLTDEE